MHNVQRLPKLSLACIRGYKVPSQRDLRSVLTQILSISCRNTHKRGSASASYNRLSQVSNCTSIPTSVALITSIPLARSDPTCCPVPNAQGTIRAVPPPFTPDGRILIPCQSVHLPHLESSVTVLWMAVPSRRSVIGRVFQAIFRCFDDSPDRSVFGWFGRTESVALQPPTTCRWVLSSCQLV